MFNVKAPDRRITQIHLKWRLAFVLMEPIGDQDNVQHLSIFVNVLIIFRIVGTVPTYGTAYIYIYLYIYIYEYNIICIDCILIYTNIYIYVYI